jgi:hypothetical protein
MKPQKGKTALQPMTEQQLKIVWLGAFRYHVGRQSYAVSDFCKILQAQWESLPKCCQDLIERDLEEVRKLWET